jgi:hypothetical protein
MSLHDLRANQLLPLAIQKRLNNAFAGQTGFSGPEILDFFSRYSNEIEPYPWGGGAPSRRQIFEDCLARFPLEEQKRIIAELLSYDGPMKHGEPPAEEVSAIEAWLAGGPTPLSAPPLSVTTLNWSFVRREWTKATERLLTDPGGAITAGRSVLESVCMHILEERQVPYSKDGDLQKLYGLAARNLKLSPDQQEEESFRRLAGACATIGNSLAGIRNEFGDSHGRGPTDRPADVRHARLVVNAAFTVSLFLIEAHLAQAD